MNRKYMKILSISAGLMAAALFAATAHAVTPVAVWDGDFTEMTQGTYTLSENGNTKTDTYLQISGDNGVLVTSTEALNVFTVIMRCSGLNLASANNQVLFTSYGADASTAAGINDNMTGVNLPANNAVCRGIWAGADWNNGATQGSVPENYTTLIYNHQQTNGTYAYALGPTSDTDNTVVRTTLYSVVGLRSSGTTYKGCAIGGLRGTTSETLLPATGLKITAIAVFSGTLTEAEMTGYVWPSEIETIVVDANTSVSALNTAIAGVGESAKKVVFDVADGVTISVDTAFSSTIPVAVESTGTVTLSAETQPDLSGVTFDVKGALIRSWLTPGVVGFNFYKNKGNDTTDALATGTWYANAADKKGTSTELFADGLSVLSWNCSTLYSQGGYYDSTGEEGTLLNGYLDDGSLNGNGAEVYLTNVPYETYDVIIYAASDTATANFLAKTVNGTTYTWDATTGSVVEGNAAWGKAALNTPVYGVNTLRIKNLSGALTIYGTAKTGTPRGGISAIQIMPPETPDNVRLYKLTLDGKATTWSAGTWTLNDQTVEAPTAGYVEIVASASTEVTVDTAVSIASLTIKGGQDVVVSIATDGEEGSSFNTIGATVESGVFKQGVANCVTGLITVDNGATFDMNGLAAGSAINIAGAGAGNWPWALGTSSGEVQLSTPPTLTGNAAIGGAGKIVLGTSGGTTPFALGGFTLTKSGSGELYCYNVRTDNGTIDIAGGMLSFNQWTALDGSETIDRHTTVTVRNGATLKNNAGRRLWIDTLNVEAGATVTTTANGYFGVSAAFNGSCDTTKLQFNDGATVTLSGDLKVATVVAGGALTVNLADGAAESTMIADDVTGLTTLTLGAEAAAMLTAGAEGTVTLGEGATLKLIVGEHELDNGYEPAATGTGAVEYYEYVEDVLTKVTDSERLDGNKLLPAVPIWSVEKDGEGNLSDGTKWSTGSMPATGSSKAAFTVEGTGTLNLDESVVYGTVYVTGSGELTLGGAEMLTVTNLIVDSGVTLKNGATLKLDNATCEGAIANAGVLLLSGEAVTVSGVITGESGSVLTNNAATAATLSGENVFKHGSEIVAASGTLNLNAAGTGLKGRIAVLAGATLVNTRSSDALDYYNASVEEPVEVEVWGALQMGGTRWSLGDGDKNILIFHDGAVISGNGDGNGALDFIEDKAGKIKTDGVVEISAKLRIRDGAVLTAEVEDGGVLTVSGGTVVCAGGLAKTGAGTLEIKTSAPNNSGGISLEEGYIVSTVFPSHNVAISDGAVFTLKDTQWVSENRFSGEGTLELYLVGSTRNFGGASTLDLPGKLKVTRTGNGWPVFTGAVSPHFSSSPELEITAGDKAGIVLDVGYIGEDNAFKVKNLSGAGIINPQNGAAGGNRFIDTLQTAATEFKGNFMAGGTGSGGDSERNAALIVRGDENIYGLTLSGTNTSKGDLVITDNGKVIFSGSGSWANGAVTVNDSGWLESTNANAVANLTLSDGANLVFPTSESVLQGLTAIVFASGVTRVYFADGVVPATGTTIIDWSGAGLTAAPAGEFELAGANSGTYKLVADTEGLKIGAAAQARIGDVAYETVADAVAALAAARTETIYILDDSYAMAEDYEAELNEAGMIWDGETRTIEFAAAIDGDGALYKTVAAAIEAGAATIVLNKDSSETVALPADTVLKTNGYAITGEVTTSAEGYVIGRTTQEGKEVYSAITNDAATWVGEDGARWEIYSNWSTGAVPGANTAVVFPARADTYTVGLSDYNNELHKCKTITAEGTVVFTYYDAGTDWYPEITLYGGEIGGDGKIILKRSGLRNLSGAKVTISCGLGVEYISTAYDSFLRDGEFEISGELTIDGYLKCDVATTATGDIVLGTGGKLRANSAVQFTGTATIADGASFTISGESALDIDTLRIEGSGSLTATSATAIGTRLIFANAENAVVAIPDYLTLGSSAVVELTQAGTLNAGTRRFDNEIVLPDGGGMKVTLAGYDELAVEFNVAGDAEVATEVLAFDGVTTLAASDYALTRTDGKLVIEPNWASVFANPVTGEKTAAKYAFFGSNDNLWETAANWREVDSAGVGWVEMADTGTIPGLPSSGKFAPILIDGNLIGDDSNKTMSLSTGALEGWALKLAALNGVDVSVATLNKFQGGCALMVDKTSKVVFNVWGSGNSEGTLDYYVAGEDSITFNMAYDRFNAVGYYLKGEGSVKYAAGVTAGTHTICRADMDIGTAGYKQVIEKTLVSFSNASVTFGLADGFAPVVNDRSDITPVESASALSGFEELGTWRIAQDSTGVKLQYVGYGSSEPEFNIMGGSGAKDWDTAANWSLGTVPSGGTAMIIPDGDMTVNLGTAISLAQLFIVNTNETAVTVNITGETLTAGVFSVQTNVTVAVTNAAQIAGTASGGGTIQYTGVASLPSGMTWTSKAWEGTLWLKDISAKFGYQFNNLGSANSTVKLSNVSAGYLNDPVNTVVNPALEIDGGGFTINDGNANRVVIFKSLSGDGALNFTHGSASGCGMVVKDASGFTGVINVATARYEVTFGDSGSSGTTGRLVIDAGKEVNIVGTNMWSAVGGMVVNGTMNIDTLARTVTLSAALTGSGTLVKTGSGILILNGSLENFAGKIRVAEGVLALWDAEIIGDGAGQIEFAEGTTLGLVDSIANDGSVTIDRTTVIWDDEKTAIKLYNSDMTASSSKITVVDNGDGTWTYSWAPMVLAWADFDFNKDNYVPFINYGQLNNNSIKNSGTGGTDGDLEKDGFTVAQSLDPETGGLYMRVHPYKGYSYPTEWSAAIYATLPALEDNVLVMFGSAGGGFLALIRGSTENEIKLVWGKRSEQSYTTLAAMKVKAATIAHHLVVFSKNSSYVNVYIDGVHVVQYPASGLSIGSGFQVGSIFEGDKTNGLTRPASDDPAEIGMIKVWHQQIGATMIASLAEKYPFISPGRKSERTLDSSTGDNDWYVNDWYVPAGGVWINTINGEAAEGDDGSLPLEDADVTITSGGDCEQWLDVVLNEDNGQNQNAVVGDLVFTGTQPITVRKSIGGFALEPSGIMSNATDLTVHVGAIEMNTVPLYMSEDATLHFDPADCLIGLRTAGRIDLTGVCEEFLDSTSNPRVTCAPTPNNGIIRFKSFGYDSTKRCYYMETEAAREAKNVYVRTVGDGVVDGDTEVYYLDGDTEVSTLPIDGDVLHFTEDSAPTNTIAPSLVVGGFSIPAGITLVLTNELSVAVSGEGNILMDGARPKASESAAATALKDSAKWKGLLEIRGVNFGNTSLDNFGNENSKLRLSGCSITPQGGSECAFKLELVDGDYGYGLKYNYATAAGIVTQIKSLTGDGTFVSPGTTEASAKVATFKVLDASDFTGVISNTVPEEATGGLLFEIGSDEATAAEGVLIASDGELTIADAIYASTNFTVRGTLKVTGEQAVVSTGNVSFDGGTLVLPEGAYPMFLAPVEVTANGLKVDLADILSEGGVQVMRVSDSDYLPSKDNIIIKGNAAGKILVKDGDGKGWSLRRGGFYLHIR